jgi:hypothetical protein
MALAVGEMTRCAARRLLYEVPHVLAPKRRIAPFRQEGERASLEDPSIRSSCVESDPTSNDLSEIRFVVGRGFRNANHGVTIVGKQIGILTPANGVAVWTHKQQPDVVSNERQPAGL